MAVNIEPMIKCAIVDLPEKGFLFLVYIIYQMRSPQSTLLIR